MYFPDGGPVLIHPQQPPPPPPQLCSFVHIVPQYSMQYAPQVFTPEPFLDAARAEVRDVWAHNFHQELSHLCAALQLPEYSCVCVDTEFPGAVHDDGTPRYLRGPLQNYALVKKNVDDLKLLQVGIALCGDGRCPVAWQFNIKGFDPELDAHAPASIAMLREQGMNFEKMNKNGIEPHDFAYCFYNYVLRGRELVWAAFSGAYDFAYLAKVLTGGKELPGTLDEFLAEVRRLFGHNVLDVKHLAKCCGRGALRGGLEQVAAALGVPRVAGRAHCAGSDSLFTADVLLAMLGRFFRNGGVLAHAGIIVDLA